MNGTKWLLAAAMTAGISGSSIYAQAQEAVVEVKEGRRGERVEVKEKEKEEERLAVSVPERGITLGNMILAPGLDLGVAHDEFDLGGRAVSGTGFEFGLGARFGIGPDFDVQAVVLPFAKDANEDFRYGDPSVQATYRFVKGAVEVGGRVAAQFITEKGASGMVLTPSIPVRLHVAKIAAIDTGVGLPLAVPFDNGKTEVGLNIPVTFLIDVVEPTVHVGAGTGFNIAEFSDAGHTIYMPLTLLAGVAIPGKDGPIVDIDPTFSFPFFVVPGNTGGGNKIITQFWTVGVAVDGYFYL